MSAALFDNHAEGIAQRKLQAMAEQSPQVQHLAQLQAKMNNSPRVEAQAQLQAAVDNSPRQVAQWQQSARMFGQPVQRQGSPEEEEPQMQTAPGTVQRQRVEDEQVLQGEFADEFPAQLAQPSEAKPNNTGLPDNLKTGVESLSGLSLDNVKVHYNSSEPAQLNAHAYAQGTDIHVGPGQEQHLPNEAWHVVQQAQGRVKSTVQMKGGVRVNDDAGLEREADLMGNKAVAGVVQAVNGAPIESDPIVSFQGQTVLQLGNASTSETDEDGGKSPPTIIQDKLQRYVMGTKENEQARMVASRLLEIINAYGSNKFGHAYQLLTDEGFLSDIGHSINKKSHREKGDDYEELVDATKTAITNAMYHPKSKILDLPFITVVVGDEDTAMNEYTMLPDNWHTPQYSEDLANIFIPVMLEEWIHMFQHMSGKVLSLGAKLFAKSKVFKKQMKMEGQNWNIREVDIYAVYLDLGWMWLREDWKSRYRERESYDQFRNEGNKRRFKYKEAESNDGRDNEESDGDTFAEWSIEVSHK